MRLLMLATVVLFSLSSIFASVAEARVAVASYYGLAFAGSPTATGEPFRPFGFTAASRTLPLNSYATVCYESCAVVRINDRGPSAWTGADIDLARGAAEAIGLYEAGKDTVQVIPH